MSKHPDEPRHVTAEVMAATVLGCEPWEVAWCNRCNLARHRRIQPCSQCGSPEYRLGAPEPTTKAK